jgi:beta-lactamase regulating signal transducer with metallopeptidase domain
VNDYSPEIMKELLQRTVVVTVAAVLIAGILYLTRPASARIHRLLWCLVLLQGWLFLQYQVPIPWYEPLPVIETEEEDLVSASPVVEIHSSPLEKETVGLALENDPSINSSSATLPVAATKNVTQSTNVIKDPVTVASPATFYWPTVLVGIWITGMLLIVVRWFFGYIRFVRSVPKTEVPDDRLSIRWDELLKKYGVKRSIALRMTESLGPMLCRLPRGYALFLPKQFWNGLSEQEQIVVLEHELAHYLRRDVWKSLCVRLLALPHWFNPCAWWAVRRFDQCAEWACDASAQQLEPEQRISYAKTLMRLVEQSGTAQPCRPALFGSSVLFRVKRLLSPHPPEDTKMKKLVLCSLVLLLIAFSLIRPQLVAQTPRPTVTAKPRFARLPESLAAVQTKKQPTVPREKLRYDGKSFEEWQALLETELKPERRAEAMRAFGEFGTRGYRREAAQAIMEIVREYNFISSYAPNSDIGKLQTTALEAFRQIASVEVLDILRAELQGGDAGRQKFVYQMFIGRSPTRSIEKKNRKLVSQLAPEFIAIAHDRESDQRINAINILYSLMPETEGVIPAFQKLMKDEDSGVSYEVCRILAYLAPETDGLAKRLVELAKDQSWEALRYLYELGPRAKPVLPDLMALIEDPRSSNKLPEVLGAIDEDALNALIEEYKKSDKPRKQKITSIFHGMGAAAKPALPFLIQEYLAETDQELRLDFTNTFNSIIRNEIERQRFSIELGKKIRKFREEKKKTQDDELDGVGVPMKPLL